MSKRSLGKQLYSILNAFLGVSPQERLKVIFTSIAFFCVISSYTLIKELKDSLFVHIVGRTYIPNVKMASVILLVPAILLYSRLVDLVRKSRLIYFYTILYGCVGLILTYFIGHPTIGLANTIPSKDRLFGWFLYLFLEGFTPFIVSLFWSFINTITSPQAAKQNYPLMIASSKLGGLLTTMIAIRILDRPVVNGNQLMLDVINHQILFALGSLFLLLVPIIIFCLMRRVPKEYMHGYEAAYHADREVFKTEKHEPWWKRLFAGLSFLVRYPYALGMFGLIFFWEVVNVFCNYERLGIGEEEAHSISAYTKFLFDGVFWVHFVGLIIVLIGTRLVISILGERKSLILVPLITGVLLTYYLVAPSSQTIILVFVIIRAVNFTFSYPLRESLYIPTTREIRFKTKSWIDSFGSKFAKFFGSSYNIFLQTLKESMVSTANIFFFGTIISLWYVTAHLIGKRYEDAVANNEVIGWDKTK